MALACLCSRDAVPGLHHERCLCVGWGSISSPHLHIAAILTRAANVPAFAPCAGPTQAPSDHEQLWLRCHIVIAQQRPLAPDAAAAFTFQPGDHQQTDSVAGASAASTAPLTAEPWPAMWVMYSPQSGATTTNAGTATGTAATSGRAAGTVSSLLQSSSIGDRAVQGAAEGYGSAVEGELLLRLPLAGAYFLPVDESGEQHSLAMLVRHWWHHERFVGKQEQESVGFLGQAQPVLNC